MYPSQGGELDVCVVVPRSLVVAADELGFVEADDGLGQGVKAPKVQVLGCGCGGRS